MSTRFADELAQVLVDGIKKQGLHPEENTVSEGWYEMPNGKRVRPTQDRVFVRRDGDTVQELRSGIQVPYSASDAITQATVVAAGPGVFDKKKGVFFPNPIKVGDRIVLGRYAGISYQFQNETLYIVDQDLIQGVVEAA